MNEFFCDECGDNSSFTKIRVTEKTSVKGMEFENEHLYYKCETCGELFEPFDNYDTNYLSDYEIYCKKNGLLTYKEIKDIRLLYKLSQRDFSKLLAMSHATISRLEKGEIPSEQQDVLFRLSSDPYAFYHKIVEPKKHLLKKDVLEKLTERLKLLMACSYEEHEEELKKLYKKLNDQTNDLKIRMNKIEYTQSMQLGNLKTIEQQKESENNIWKQTSRLRTAGLL